MDRTGTPAGGISILSLFSGIGGLDLGVETAVPGSRVVCHVERDAFAQAVLLERMERTGMGVAPIWTDVSTFAGEPFRGLVDIITGGFPCQDISQIGSREGIKAGTRSGLWGEFARIICEVRPRFAFIENVSDLLIRGGDVVLSDLAAMGFDAEWGTFRADEHGSAPHRRERIFIMAYSRGERLEGVGAGRATPGSTGRGCGADLFPPRPKNADAWGKIIEEQPYRLPAIEPGVQFMVDGVPLVVDADRVDALRANGNAVVPSQAAFAFTVLCKRAGVME